MPAEQYDYRYSDRDVREDPRLHDLAVGYIRQYGGNFEPLLKLKMAMADGQNLNVPQARLVLNCMRHDSNVADSLPKPLYPYLAPPRAEEGRVIQLVPRPRNRREPMREPCGNAAPHEVHGRLGEDEFGAHDIICPGVPEPINRSGWTQVEANVKAKFASGTSGFLVHKTTGEGYVKYLPRRHEWGYRQHIFKVKLVCKNPGWLSGPLLYLEEPVHLYQLAELPRERCVRCFTADELREGPTFPKPSLIPQFLPPES